MTTIIAIAALTAFAALVVGLLQYTWRSTADLPHAPLGGDAAHDEDLHRVLHDLAAR